LQRSNDNAACGHHSKFKPLGLGEIQAADDTQELAVTEGAIKAHLHNVYNKLAIPNRTTLALLCVKQIEAVE
jgi:hypothetical protein